MCKSCDLSTEISQGFYFFSRVDLPACVFKYRLMNNAALHTFMWKPAKNLKKNLPSLHSVVAFEASGCCAGTERNKRRRTR